MKKILLAALFAIATLVSGCNNDDLWGAVNDLTGRVQALETQVKELNKNIEALRELYSGKTITNVTTVDGKYIITLSDGSIIELKQGSDAESIIPIIGINNDGFWQVSYDGGKTFQSLNVKATASDGVTPRFRIDEATGYWQVSYDKGVNYENVLDTAGLPVKAIGTGTVTDKFFDTIEVRDGLFYIKLLDGTELNIPILPDFFCIIKTPAEGAQPFTLGEVRTFSVEIKGAEGTIVTAPDGWAASLSTPAANEATLTVIAPAISTRATADNTKDVAILITSNGYATISKIEVVLSAQPTPTATVALSTTTPPTSSTLSFDITTTNANGWKWLCLPSADAAPAVEKILADGTVGVGNAVTVTALTSSTKYKIYVVAHSSAINSGIQSAEGTTTSKDYYEEGIIIDGVTYNKSTTGAQLVTATTTIDNTSSVYFIDPAAGAVVSISGMGNNGFEKLILIGRYSDAKPTVKLTGYLSMKATAPAYGIAMKNITLDGSAYTNYLFNAANSTAAGVNERLWIDGCTIISGIDKAFSYFNNDGSIANITLTNNRIVVNASVSTTSQTLISFAKAASIPAIRSVEISNNIFYAPNNEPKLALITSPNIANADLMIRITNNTFINTPGSNGYVQIGEIKSIEMVKNIIWFSANSCYMARLTSATASTTTTASVADNKGYDKAITVFVRTNSGLLPAGVTENVTIVPESADPFTGGTFDLSLGNFIPNTTYAGYGARLK